MADDRNLGTGETSVGVPRTGERKPVRQEAQQFQEDLRRKGESLLSEQKGSVAKFLQGIANAIEKTAKNLEEEGQSNTARYTRQAAKGIQDFAHDLRERDLDGLRRQVVDLARRQPALVAGGAVALGFLAARFFKSSAENTEPGYAEKMEVREEMVTSQRKSAFEEQEEEFHI
ncbi:MAG: hypothetical protein R2940_14995 [Syntrophotaleaceae bacterium]